MFSRCLTICLLALSAGTLPAGATPLRDVNGPAELPPASFTGNRYVDSKGCVFIRAGYGGNVVWVPQVNRNRQLLCGETPSLATDDPPVQIAKATAPVRAKTAAARPRASGVPAGFKPAWSDGRLNPLRGPRTEEGDAQMALIWTETVPRRLKKGASTLAVAPAVVVSSKSEQTVGQAGDFIQIGVFGEIANARAVQAFLDAAGVPGRLKNGSVNGQSVSVVLAGPFFEKAELQDALSVIRSAGYTDAFARR